jgi:hypothetical protein
MGEDSTLPHVQFESPWTFLSAKRPLTSYGRERGSTGQRTTVIRVWRVAERLRIDGYIGADTKEATASLVEEARTCTDNTRSCRCPVRGGEGIIVQNITMASLA